MGVGAECGCAPACPVGRLEVNLSVLVGDLIFLLFCEVRRAKE